MFEATKARTTPRQATGEGPLVIAIDGPSGSGKSSTARGVASRLGLAYLDTGAMYRAASWLTVHEGVDRTDSAAVAALVAAAVIDLNLDPNELYVAINAHDVTEAIRAPEVSAVVSTIATNLDVRTDLVARQKRLIAEAGDGIVAEGRDITTVVAPQAPVRVLLVADPAARVARRHAELGEHVEAHAVADQVIRRDRDDSTVAQFESATPGVEVIDSTYLSLDEVIEAICALVPSRTTGPARR